MLVVAWGERVVAEAVTIPNPTIAPVDEQLASFVLSHPTAFSDSFGLGIVQRSVRRLRGRRWAEAKVEQGAAFYFTLYSEDA